MFVDFSYGFNLTILYLQLNAIYYYNLSVMV